MRLECELRPLIHRPPIHRRRPQIAAQIMTARIARDLPRLLVAAIVFEQPAVSNPRPGDDAEERDVGAKPALGHRRPDE